MKEFLSYVRILVDVFIDEEILEIISFEIEWGEIGYI